MAVELAAVAVVYVIAVEVADQDKADEVDVDPPRRLYLG